MTRDHVETIAEWRELAKVEPLVAANEVRRRIAERMNESQRRAVWAKVAPKEALETQIDSAVHGSTARRILAGVPFAVKDLFEVAGWPTRAGSVFLDEERPLAKHDGALVAALKSLGAVPAGKTHLHEFAYGVTGENPHYGDCEIPGKPGRLTGGSSSGSAAAVAAGIVPFALGTDTGGSIRVPASFCGLYGFRTTPGHAWIKDAFPLGPCCDTAGWFTKKAEDMLTLNGALIGLGKARREPRGCYLEFGRLDADVAAACRQAVNNKVINADAETQEQLHDAFTETTESYLVLTGAEAAATHAPWLERRRADYSEAVWQRLDRGRKRTMSERLRAEVRRRYVHDTLTAYFLAYDFLILPAVPCGAPTKAECNQAHRERILELNTPVSLAGLPVLTIPVPLPSRLSAGIQVVVPDATSPVISWILGR